MKYAGLALWLLTNLWACSRGGSATHDAGGATAGQASGESSGPGGSGNGGGDQTGTGGSASATGGGGVTVTSANSTGFAGATGSAGRSAEVAGITAGTSAAEAGATGSTCGATVVHASRTAPDVLLVLDRSASMSYEITVDGLCRRDGGTCKDRWSILASALSTAISDTPSIHWGLKLLPSGNPASGSCMMSTGIEVSMAADSGSQILRIIQATMPAGNTPTRKAIIAAASYLKTVDDQNSKFILLATDGLPNCGGDRPSSDPDLEATVDAIKNAGFPVYVVGIGPQPSLMALEEFAQAGGTGHYFPATSPEELAAALLSITESVATCTFKLSASPPDPDNVTVLLDQKVIPLDSAHGWGCAGDTRTIELHGDSCNALKSNAASTLTVRFNCANATATP